MFTSNTTFYAEQARASEALEAVDRMTKVADANTRELAKVKLDLNKQKELKKKAERSVGDWKIIASAALTRVANYSGELTGETFDSSPVKRENFTKRFDMHIEVISREYNTMSSKYDYKVGEMLAERKAKEEALVGRAVQKNNLMKVERSLEATTSASLKALETVKELAVDALGESGTTLQLPTPQTVGFPGVLVAHTGCCVHAIKQVMEQSDVDASDAEVESKMLKEQKAALKATLALRDEEITRLKAEVATVNARFDALTSLTTENIVNRYSNLVNSANKRMRLTDGSGQ